jgi:hypothetical protein
MAVHIGRPTVTNFTSNIDPPANIHPKARTGKCSHNSPYRKLCTEKSLAGKLGISCHLHAVADMGPAYPGYTVLGKDFPCPSP